MRQDTQEAVNVIESCAGFTDEATPAGEAWQAILGELNGLHSERTRLIGMSNHQARVIEDLNELQDCKDLLQRLGNICGCDHVESRDERFAQVQHIEEEWDRLKDENSRLKSELKMWKPMTEAEVESALNEIESETLDEDELERIMEKVLDPGHRLPESSWVLMAAKIRQLKSELATLWEKLAAGDGRAVVVNPLEWETLKGGRFRSSRCGYAYFVDTDRRGWYVAARNLDTGSVSELHGHKNSAQSAMALANEHNAQQVLACLEGGELGCKRA